MPNIELVPYEHQSSFRRIAAAAWDDMFDATIYGQLKVRAEPMEAWIEKIREQTGVRITYTHVVARALALILRRNPDINAVVMRRTLYMRKDVDLFVQVALKSEDPDHLGKTDLTGLVVRKADEYSVTELAEHIRAHASRLRSGDDKAFKRTKKQASLVPGFVLRWLLKAVDFLQYTLNLDTSFLGAPRDPFGSAMVTSVGMLGARVGYAPFFPLARVPVILCLGAVSEEPVVEEGEVVPGRVIYIQATMDHRVVDGFHAGTLSKEMVHLLTHPEELETPDA